VWRTLGSRQNVEQHRRHRHDHADGNDLQFRTERSEDVEARVQRILELAAEIGRGMPPGYLDQDFDELLYDERGLPK
jgi:hypothetical protein